MDLSTTQIHHRVLAVGARAKNVSFRRRGDADGRIPMRRRRITLALAVVVEVEVEDLEDLELGLELEGIRATMRCTATI